MATSAGGIVDDDRCELLGPFAVFVQASLGVLALSVLVIKRWRERPRRTTTIWFGERRSSEG